MKAKSMKNSFSLILSEVFENIGEYIVSPEAIINKEKEEEENANEIIQHLNNINER